MLLAILIEDMTKAALTPVLEKIFMSIYDEIHKRAEPYWDTRQNNVHVPVAYGFARRLLAYYPEADEGVVLPAVLLHDVGWKMVPEEKQLDAFGPEPKDKATGRLHETEGARIAEEILTSLHYDKEKIQEALTIIDGHDSRPESLSLNDKLVKDADRLWRFTPTGVSTDHTRFGIKREDYLEFLGTMIDVWLFTPEAKKMAREEWNRARLDKGSGGTCG